VTKAIIHFLPLSTNKNNSIINNNFNNKVVNNLPFQSLIHTIKWKNQQIISLTVDKWVLGEALFIKKHNYNQKYLSQNRIIINQAILEVIEPAVHIKTN
jgi:hypothetical protein